MCPTYLTQKTLQARGKLPYTRKLDDREAYDHGRFFTVTGRPVPGSPVGLADCQAVIDAHFTRLFPPKPKNPTAAPEAARATPAAGAEPDDEKLLARIRASGQGDKFAALFDRGDTSGHKGDDSRADLALCCVLAWWTQKDAGRVDRLFRLSKLCRGKWEDPRGEGRTYGSSTIEEAIAHTGDGYDPRHRTNKLLGGLVGNEPPTNRKRSEPASARPGADRGQEGDPAVGDTEDVPDRPNDDGDDEPEPGDDKKADDEKKGRPAAATRLVELAQEAGVRLFHTAEQEAYAQVPHGGHLEVHAVRGTQFRRFLAKVYFKAEGKAANGETMTTATGTLEAIGAIDGPEHPVYRRVAPGPDGAIVLDLCDDRWRAVVIRPGGWEVTDHAPVMFARSNVMKPLPVPERGGELTDLRRFLNLKSDGDWLLVVAWLCAALRPMGPYPLLHPKGEQGTAKTTFGKMLRRLFDPNKVDLRSQPREERDLAVSSRHGWALCYDNLSAVPLWLSDALCRVATGGGIGTRTLYSNDEETTFDFTRPVLITSIEDVIGQPDLLDRSLGLELMPIPDAMRKTEDALWADYDAALPGILGGLLDVVAKALELLPGIVAEKLPVPRMADFALFGEATARATGAPPGRFLEILARTRSNADQEALQGSPVALVLYAWIKERGTFAGVYTQLLAELNGRAGFSGRPPKGWPPNAQALGALVRRISPALRRLGVDVAHDTVGHARTRTVTITYAPAKGRGTSSASSAAGGNLFDEQDLSADDPPAPTPSAHRPQDDPSSAPSDRHAARADDPPAAADDMRTTPSSAPKYQSHKEVKCPADDADDLLHTVSDGSTTAGSPTASSNGRHYEMFPAGGTEEGEL